MSKLVSLAIVLRMRALVMHPHPRREDINEVMLAAAEQIAELERQLEGIQKEWKIAGRNPQYYKDIKAWLMIKWPMMYEALKRLDDK